MKKAKGSIVLIIASLIWGFTFVAQSDGMNYLGPYTFNAVRFGLGFLVLLPFAIYSLYKERDRKDFKPYLKTTILAGLLCGVPEALGSTFQQLGVSGSGASKAGFITALYIVFVAIFGKKKQSGRIYVSILIAVVGFYLLCINGEFRLSWSDFYLLLCAFAYCFQILCIDKYANDVNVLTFNMMQFFVTDIVSIVLMLLKETPDMASIMACKIPILYSGILSCGVAYTLQIVGQKDLDPTLASLLMSLESVFAAVGGAIVLHEKLTSKELFGCALIFVAVILSQLPEKLLKNPLFKG